MITFAVVINPLNNKDMIAIESIKEYVESELEWFFDNIEDSQVYEIKDGKVDKDTAEEIIKDFSDSLFDCLGGLLEDK